MLTPTSGPADAGHNTPTPKGLALINAAAVEVRAVEWLWPPYIPKGKVVFLDGDPGCGKSQIALGWCALITKGHPWPGSTTRQEPGTVLYFTREDDPDDTVVPRLIAAGADLDRVLLMADPFNLSNRDDLLGLEAVITEHHPRLIVLDTLSGYLGSKVDTFRDNQVRPVLDRLAFLARRYGVTFVLLRHLVKGERAKALYLGSGSITFAGVGRSVLMAVTRANTEERALFHIKSNLAAMGEPIGYTFETVPVKGAGKVSRVLWGGASSMTTADIFTDERASTGTEKKTKTQEATDALLRVFEHRDEVAVDTLKTMAAGLDVGWRTFEAVKKTLLIESEKKTDGKWWWRMTTKTAADFLARYRADDEDRAAESGLRPCPEVEDRNGSEAPSEANPVNLNGDCALRPCGLEGSPSSSETTYTHTLTHPSPQGRNTARPKSEEAPSAEEEAEAVAAQEAGMTLAEYLDWQEGPPEDDGPADLDAAWSAVEEALGRKVRSS